MSKERPPSPAQRTAEAAERSAEAHERAARSLGVIREILQENQRLDEPRPPQREPHRLSVALFARAIPGYADQFKRLPRDYWFQGLVRERVLVTIVHCVCGHLVWIVDDEQIEPCAGRCGRAFVRSAAEVYRAPWPS